MTEILKHIYNACDPYQPAPEEYYLDCSEVRGDSALAGEYIRRLQLADDYLSFLFSGHIGCGKSSELKHLCRILENAEQGQRRFFPVLLNVSDYLDDYDADVTDLLLAIVAELAASLRERLKIKLEDNYFAKRFNEIKRFLLREVDIDEVEIPLWEAKTKIKLLKRDPGARDEVRKALAPKTSSMLEEINTVFEEARLQLKKKRVRKGEMNFSDLVVILDNLEKIRRFAGKEEGLESQRELFLDRYTQLTGMQAHFIYTVPLRLVRSMDGPQLEQRYDGAPFVLPMVKVIERETHDSFTPGIDSLKTMLQKRVGEHSLEEIFDDAALEFLLKYSGGQVRSLMIFVQSACAYAEKLPISLEAAHRAVHQTVRTYSTAIPESHWDKLARLDASTDHAIPGGDADYLAMLENLSVLEYINGRGDDPFAPVEPWYAVNPIVRELKKFKAARAALSKIASS